MALTHAGDLEARDSRIGPGMGHAHAAEAHHQDALLGHLAAPLPSIWRRIACRRFRDSHWRVQDY
jgi:hypothetical protein